MGKFADTTVFKVNYSAAAPSSEMKFGQSLPPNKEVEGVVVVFPNMELVWVAPVEPNSEP